MTREKLKTVSWDTTIRVGIDKDYLDRMGYMDILLSGEPTPPMNMYLNMHGAIIWMEGTIRLVEDETGKVIIDVRPTEKEDSDEQE